MNKQGTVMRWDNAKAFGFIRSPETAADIFFHIHDYQGDSSPHNGMRVVFEEIHVGGKGPRAMSVRRFDAASPQKKSTAAAPSQPRPGRVRAPAGQPCAALGRDTSSRTRPASPSTAMWLLLAIWLCLLLWGTYIGRWTWTLWLAAGALNVITFAAYWKDKAAAQNGAWRTPESTLHLLSLAGGWPAAKLAQHRLRHKSSKDAFLLVHGITAALNTLALAAWLLSVLTPL